MGDSTRCEKDVAVYDQGLKSNQALIEKVEEAKRKAAASDAECSVRRCVQSERALEAQLAEEDSYGAELRIYFEEASRKAVASRRSVRRCVQAERSFEARPQARPRARPQARPQAGRCDILEECISLQRSALSRKQRSERQKSEEAEAEAAAVKKAANRRKKDRRRKKSEAAAAAKPEPPPEPESVPAPESYTSDAWPTATREEQLAKDSDKDAEAQQLSKRLGEKIKVRFGSLFAHL